MAIYSNNFQLCGKSVTNTNIRRPVDKFNGIHRVIIIYARPVLKRLVPLTLP